MGWGDGDQAWSSVEVLVQKFQKRGKSELFLSTILEEEKLFPYDYLADNQHLANFAYI